MESKFFEALKITSERVGRAIQNLVNRRKREEHPLAKVDREKLKAAMERDEGPLESSLMHKIDLEEAEGRAARLRDKFANNNEDEY